MSKTIRQPSRQPTNPIGEVLGLDAMFGSERVYRRGLEGSAFHSARVRQSQDDGREAQPGSLDGTGTGAHFRCELGPRIVECLENDLQHVGRKRCATEHVANLHAYSLYLPQLSS